MFFAHFKNANSYIRNFLFNKYCTSFYGAVLLPLFDDSLKYLCTSWRKAMRRVWRIPWRTHCNMLPHIAKVMDPDLILAKRFIKFINNVANSGNNTVNTISNMGLQSNYYILGANDRHLKALYNMQESNVCRIWDEVYFVIRVCSQIRELIALRDSTATGQLLSHAECKMVIDHLCIS